MKSLTIIQPDDFHVHLRDGAMLRLVAPHSARHFGRILVMPNLDPPITTVEQALAYRKRILQAMSGKRESLKTPEKPKCLPLMTLYLTERTSRKTVREVAEAQEVIGFKLYPAHSTTQSQFGVGKIERVFPVLEEMEKRGVYLMIHGEDTSVDIFDREKVFVEKTLARIADLFPSLKITLEHITTKESVDFIREASPHIKAGVTPHHLLLDRNDLLSGGLQPHHYCMPIVKRSTHRDYLLREVLSGNEKFFLGTDTAPHTEKNKLTACGCAGIYSAPVALAVCAEIFEKNGALQLLENFSSVFGARHYGLELNSKTVTLVKQPEKVPGYYSFTDGGRKERLIPFRSGATLSWRTHVG